MFNYKKRVKMRVQIQSIHFDADAKLIAFIENKVKKLETFYDKIVDSEIYLKVDKDSSKENKVVEIKMGIPGKSLFAKEQKNSFEAATDDAVEGLRRQLKKYKEKQFAH